MKKAPPAIPEMTSSEYRQHLGVVLRQKNQFAEDIAVLRSQVLQLQKVSEYLEKTYYEPMTRGIFRRLWYAIRIKRILKQR